MIPNLSTSNRRSLIRPWAALCLLVGTLLLLIGPAAGQSAEPTVRVLTIDGTITPPMAQYIARGIESAEDDGVAAIVIEIDTPGGLSTAMDDITRNILESEVPVIAYVTPRGARAASAGVFIAYAAHVAAMAPGTSIGSASPVNADGSDINETMSAKVTNDAVSNIRNLADLRNRNADWAERAVREADNITADRALELNVVNVIAPDIDTLLDRVDGMRVTMSTGETVTLTTANAETDDTSMNLFERILQLASDPTIAYLLLSFGSLGIFLELANPGTFVPGIVGVISLVLGLYSLGTLPVNWTGVLLIGIGLALFLIDLFVSSFGLLLVAGLACFITGSYLLIDTNVPGYENVSRPIIWTSAACIVAVALIVGTAALRALRRRPSTGTPALIGRIGTVRSELNPTGMVFLDGELWTATMTGSPGEQPTAPVGSHIEVTGVHGLRLDVRLAPATSETAITATADRRGEGVLPVVDGLRAIRRDRSQPEPPPAARP
ncbi:MAG TPA: nodulation protein NfeD [Thermomicrobiales bacterium]|nr:nodulation protein NfeD [Thermomicrobiales bacterium]